MRARYGHLFTQPLIAPHTRHLVFGWTSTVENVETLHMHEEYDNRLYLQYKLFDRICEYVWMDHVSVRVRVMGIMTGPDFTFQRLGRRSPQTFVPNR